VARLVIQLKECVELNAKRTGRRLTYPEVAARAKLSSDTIKKISNRRHPYNATVKTIEKLCKALNVAPADLLKWE
jgi:DNA-binding Xre family transcriptional regulator